MAKAPGLRYLDPMLPKPEVIAALLADLRADLAALERVHQQAVDEATGSESRSEDKHDTRATEASYLAAGQTGRLLALRRLILALELEQHPPLFEVEGEDGPAFFLLAPDGAGRKVRVRGQEVTVITAHSPLGQALEDARAGEVVQVALGKGIVDYEVIAVG